MLHFYYRPMFGGDRFLDTDDLLPAMGGFTPVGQSDDCSLDSALRNVPLPEGLVTRLSMLAYSLPDDGTD